MNARRGTRTYLQAHDEFLYQKIHDILPVALNGMERAREDWEEFQKKKSDQPAPVQARTNPMEIRRWPVQIISATYGTAGKNADVTAKVKEYVESTPRKFSANPVDLGADPNPGWNKGLHIIYMKDGVRREQHRNENETVLPESFYGPQDEGELRAWLPGSRWMGEKPEIEFNSDQTFTSPGAAESFRWEATGPKNLRLTWSEGKAIEFTFDYTWSSFSQVGDAKSVYHLLK